MKKDTKGVALPVRKLLTKEKIDALSKTAQKAIYANAHGDVDTLREDIRNSVRHVFGDHTECKDYLCDKVGDVSKKHELEEMIKCGAHHHIYGSLNVLLSKIHLLIDNETSNRAELFMSILARFNMGKRLNLIQRDSFNTRSYLTGLRYNEGHTWQREPWKKYMGESPGKHFKAYMNKEDEAKRKRKCVFRDVPKCGKKLKLDTENQDYGSNIAEVHIEEKDLHEEIDKLIERLQVH